MQALVIAFGAAFVSEAFMNLFEECGSDDHGVNGQDIQKQPGLTRMPGCSFTCTNRLVR